MRNLAVLIGPLKQSDRHPIYNFYLNKDAECHKISLNLLLYLLNTRNKLSPLYWGEVPPNNRGACICWCFEAVLLCAGGCLQTQRRLIADYCTPLSAGALCCTCDCHRTSYLNSIASNGAFKQFKSMIAWLLASTGKLYNSCWESFTETFQRHEIIVSNFCLQRYFQYEIANAHDMPGPRKLHRELDSYGAYKYLVQILHAYHHLTPIFPFDR